jgi:MFS family permease
VVVNAYLIAFGGLLLLAGRVGDLIGRRRVFLAGVGSFTAASLVPIGLAVLAVAARLVERDPGLGLQAGTDVPGALLIMSALMLAVYTIVTPAAQDGWGATPTLELALLCIALLAAFFVREATAKRPLIPPRFGVRALLVPGLALIGAGLIVFSQTPVHATYLLNVMPAMTLLGIGGGVCFLALMNVGMAGVGHEDAGLASGLLDTGAQAGGALGLAVLATLAGSRSGELIKHGRTTTVALTSGYHLAFLIAAGLVAPAIPTVLATRPARAGAEAIPTVLATRPARAGAEAIAADAPAAGRRIARWPGRPNTALDGGEGQCQA